jgi:threonine 3-dehydrogenase
MAIALAKRLGARKIFATDLRQFRLDLAVEMGADDAYNPAEKNMTEALMKKAQVEGGVDVLLEMSGSGDAIRQGFGLLRNGGTAVLVGLPKHPLEFDFANALIAKGTTTYGVIGREIFATWDAARKFMGGEDGIDPIDLSRVITHRLPLEDFLVGVELMKSGMCGKVLLFPDRQSLSESSLA